MKKTIISGFVAAALTLLDSCAKNPVTGKNDLMLMSEQQEIAMGQQSDPEIISFFGLYNDEALQKKSYGLVSDPWIVDPLPQPTIVLSE